MICDLSNDRTSTYNYNGDCSWARGDGCCFKSPAPRLLPFLASPEPRGYVTESSAVCRKGLVGQNEPCC